MLIAKHEELKEHVHASHIHTLARAHKHTLTHIDRHTYVYTCTHKLTHLPTRTPTYTHTHTHTRAHTHTHARTQARTHARTNTHAQTHTHKHTHTHTSFDNTKLILHSALTDDNTDACGRHKEVGWKPSLFYSGRELEEMQMNERGNKSITSSREKGGQSFIGSLAYYTSG